MGTNKALIEIDGTPMALRCVQALREAGATPVFMVGGISSDFEGWGVEHIADNWPGEGPLGAIVTAFGSVDASLLMVVPCDLLDPSPDAIEAICDLIGSHDAVVPIVDGREQWLFSLWTRRALHHLEAAFERGSRSIRSAVSGLDLHCPVVRRTGEGPGAYADADTPEQLMARRPRPTG